MLTVCAAKITVPIRYILYDY